MNPFDAFFLHLINGLAGRSWTIDGLALALKTNDLFKGGVVTALLWWAWFQPGAEQPKRRRAVLVTTAAAFTALLAGRLLAWSLPFRLRPLQNPEAGVNMAIGLSPMELSSWNSMPSDHAVLFFSLAAGLCFASRALGALALLHAVFVVCLPRVYLGLHYPSDILVGAMIGILIAWTAHSWGRLGRGADVVLGWERRQPAAFYAGFFLMTAQMSVLFTDLRDIGEWGVEAAQKLLGG